MASLGAQFGFILIMEVIVQRPIGRSIFFFFLFLDNWV